MCAALPYTFTEEQKEAARTAREERMRTIVVTIDPVIVETLKALKARGLKLGLISNADASDWIHWHESPLAPLFDDVIFSCNVGMVKPDKAIYDLSLKNLGVKPQEALFVGDGGSDEHFGARRAGMHTVCTEYILQYSGRQRKWIYRNAEYVIRDFRDLLKVSES